ncbi:unnamed protein product [Colletotrichum noveboracense]|uniref:Uncharacterized protein n=1 Tax=Colletotrichum noveboracense TaxID=2664923 RepID=A0A9W4W922_9PEZI|nr:unnamed protein product [Colletotrichum noveboracense]
MALKRKRSASELVTLFNSPARSDSSVESFDFPISPSLAFPRAFATPSHLDSRTRKRFRDNRPSQEEVHQRTLQMLYSAQQQDQNMENALSSSPAPAPAVARNTQKSLHSFWNIKSAQPPVSRTASPPVHQRALSPTSCEDCGTELGTADADGMDIDGCEGDNACGACGKHVCSQCSITNLGEQRRCLHCSGSKSWVKGSTPAWATSSMRMF